MNNETEKREGIEWIGIERINLPMLIFSIIFSLIGFAIIFLNPDPSSFLTAAYLDTALTGNAVATAGLLGILLSLQE